MGPGFLQYMLGIVDLSLSLSLEKYDLLLIQMSQMDLSDGRSGGGRSHNDGTANHGTARIAEG